MAGTWSQFDSSAIGPHEGDEQFGAEVPQPPGLAIAGELADESVQVRVGVELQITGAPECQPVADLPYVTCEFHGELTHRV